MNPIRYLRRPPKPAARKGEARKVERAPVNPANAAPAAHSIEIEPGERAALAESLAYFCVACGREHASGGIRHDDIACAEAEIAALIRRAQ